MKNAPAYGAGSCSGLFTANTMACVTETLGLSLPFCATTHAADKANEKMAYNSGKQIIKLVEADLKPSDILTQEAFNNAITVDMALGGSSNTALHIPAIANEIEGVEVNLDLFDKISRVVPHICLISPAGTDTMMDLHKKLEEFGSIKNTWGPKSTHLLLLLQQKH